MFPAIHRMILYLFLCLGGILLVGDGFAQQKKIQVLPLKPYKAPRHYICYQPSEKLTIDGHLNEPSWLQAAWSEDFLDIEGVDCGKPYFQTKVKMLWDQQFLYIAAYLEGRGFVGQIEAT